jgi:glycosidase
MLACSPAPDKKMSSNTHVRETDLAQLLPVNPQGKPVVYQVFTRLFGNTNTTNKPWGTIQENGVGKFSDFTDVALQGIHQLGTTHVWYTGVPQHAVITDYTEIGISNDDPDVVKGRAGSPYAVKDYYSVNPDLADDPANRLAEFEALIQRTHKNGMQVIIDIVPNHVARHYQSLARPDGVNDFGQMDETSVEYAKNNNFYYIQGQDFSVPDFKEGYQVLGGATHPMSDGQFAESPAKWTGNGSRLAQPDLNDWYETVKVNYGVKPDGSYDFPRLSEQYMQLDVPQHAAFWQGKVVPDSWLKFRDITHYWLDKGVDGFRYDMAEMVPVEFWSYLNSSIKMKNPQAFLLAEVYNPDLYRQYIQLGKMDYLYDKVEFYDSLKALMQGKEKARKLHQIQAGHADIEQHMLHFLENHDEQRIPADDFAGKVGGAEMGKPALVVSALISRSPTLLYFGQEVGEDGSEDLGFGDPTRTSIFDYGGVPAHQRWMNDGKFDGGQLTSNEQALRDYYVKVMKISAYHPAMLGQYMPIDISLESIVGEQNEGSNSRSSHHEIVAFIRYAGEQRLLVVSHFSATDSVNLNLVLQPTQLAELGVGLGDLIGTDLLTGQTQTMQVTEQQGFMPLRLAPMQSIVIQL